jgi:hypothetical protein
MSTILGAGGIISSSDDRINDPRFRDDNYVRLRGRYQFLWPCSVQINASVLIMDKSLGMDWGKYSTRGTHARKMVIGVTRDSTGAPLGGCTVDLFNTAGDVVVDTVVSEPDGYFAVGDPNGVNCYMVAYLAGAPDVAGTTVNTLTGV